MVLSEGDSRDQEGRIPQKNMHSSLSKVEIYEANLQREIGKNVL